MEKNKYYFTIDGGTSNTRILLWNKDLKMIDSEKNSIGIKDVAIEGSNKDLQLTIKNSLNTLLMRNKINYDNIKCILAAGMITSSLGIYELDHLVAPVSIEDLANGIKSVNIDEICPVPINFIPGIKNMSNNDVNEDNFEKMDVMRGEEVEVVSILSKIKSKNSNYIIVLPGSHTKFVTVSGNKILGSTTSITGELLSLLQTQSILSEATGDTFLTLSDYDKTMCLMGYRKAKKLGTGRSAFLTRIMKMFLEKNEHQCSSYLLGVVLENDVEALKSSMKLFHTAGDNQIIITGKEPFKNALYDIFTLEEKFEFIESFDEKDINLSGDGCMILAKVKGLL